jgi:predicted RND superfamily exporter protein
MSTFDKIVAVVALLGFIVFLSIVAVFVQEIALTIVIAIGVAMAVYDFVRVLRYGNRTGH